MDDTAINQSGPRTSIAKSTPASTSLRGVDAFEDGEDDDDGDEGVEMGRDNNTRLSMISRKSMNRTVDAEADTDDEMPSEAGGPSFRFDGNTEIDDINVEGDGAGQEEQTVEDIGVAAAAVADDDEDDDDDDAAMEEEAVAAEEGEEDGEVPSEPERHPRPTAKRGRKRVDPIHSAVVAKKKKTTRLSRLENGQSSSV